MEKNIPQMDCGIFFIQKLICKLLYIKVGKEGG